MNLNSRKQKQQIKSKVSQLMQEYQRIKQVQQQQKQQIKKQIMMSIINNKKQRQSQNHLPVYQQQNTFKTSLQQPINSYPSPILQKQLSLSKQSLKNSIKIQNKPNISLESLKQSSKNQFLNDALKQVTFSKRDIKSIEKNEQIQKIQQNVQQIIAKENRCLNIIEKYSNKYLKNNSIKHISSQQYQPVQDQQQKMTRSKIKQIIKDSIQRPVLSYSQIHANKLSSDKYNYKYQEQQRSFQDVQQIEDKRPVFLTMQQSESMTAQDFPKNYAFEIKLQNQNQSQMIQKLRFNKIQQLQKKRKQHIQQFRKNEQQKKVDLPKSRNTSNAKLMKQKQQIKQNNEINKKDYSRFVKLQDKQKSQKNFSGYQNKTQYQQSHYNIKQKPPQQTSSNYQEKNYKQYDRQYKNKTDYEQKQINKQFTRAISPHRTPKSIISQSKGKGSKNSTIFGGDSGYSRQKSGSKVDLNRKTSFNKQSNKKLMINSITHVCLPGQLNRKQREKIVQVLETSEHEFFIFLFKQYSRKIVKGIYILDSTQTKLQKIYGDKAPLQITSDKVQQFYRFDSGSRQFKKVDGCRSFSLAIHAIDLR